MMGMKKCSWMNTDTAMLVLRIGVGAIFIFAGWMKVHDLPGTVGMFAGMGFSAFWAYVASFVEFLGGIAVLLGVGTRVAAGLLAVVMIVAAYVVHSNPMMLMTPVSLLFSTLALALASGGKYSLSNKFAKKTV